MNESFTEEGAGFLKLSPIPCEGCGIQGYGRTLGLCQKCARTPFAVERASRIHPERVNLNGKSPICRLCANECSDGVCGLRRIREGKRVSLVSTKNAILHAYEDPLPTNCCNAWFCPASGMKGVNLAVFYYGCNFDCLFCQNWEHKLVEKHKSVGIQEMVERAMKSRVRCICHFGGSPEPQLPFALRFSEEVLKKTNDVMICWEWNGSGIPDLTLRAAELSHISRGTVKFDLKAYNENLHILLTGRSNRQALHNFAKIYEKYPEVLSASTLLVPYYVDEEEVENLARFIASFSPHIPYSLLVFHPDYRLNDLPITPVDQVTRCYHTAKKYLKRVRVGNIHLLLSTLQVLT